MSKLKSFEKLDSVKKQSNKSSWIILSVSVLVVTIIIFVSYAKYLNTSKEVAIANSTTGDFYYREDLLNGTEPVLTDNLIPVTISDTGSVAKADLYSEWYKYEDKRWANAVKLFEKEVTTIKDSSDNGNDGTVYGNLVEGCGYASFDGTDDYIDTEYLVDYSENFTIEVYFKYKNTGIRQTIMNDGVIDFYINENGGVNISIAATIDDVVSAPGIIIDASNFEDGSWYKILYTYDGSMLNCYMNSTLYKSKEINNLNINSTTYSLKIGVNYRADDRYFSSRIGFIGFYSNVFTESQIVSYFNSKNFISNDSAIFEYKFYDVYEEDMNDITEDDIESYFVWIPKYSYQLFDLGSYSSVTSVENKEQTINIRFGKKDTSDGVLGECSTPGVAGGSGNCSVGDYMTHPAFLSFDTTGFWVGKFETGYEGATTKAEAQINESNINKVIIKPNVYSWRSATVGNMFKTSYDYIRSDESHMMKNTEWGAVAYLQHSLYGSATSVRINNNTAYITGYSSTEEPVGDLNNGVSVEGNRTESTELGIDGTYTLNYLNSNSVISSTTGNYTGVYDMSGGTWEYVVAVNINTTSEYEISEITTIYPSFLSDSYWDKYYDKYSSNSVYDYDDRIFGDALGELGPFENVGNERYFSSWYNDHARMSYIQRPWLSRGGMYHDGKYSGIFASFDITGGALENRTFRIVLAPSK